VSWERRGVATGANMFCRSVGSAVGVAIFGAVVNSHVSDELGSSSIDLQHVSSAILEPAIHDVFLVSVFITVVLLAVAFLMPTRVTEPEAPAEAAQVPAVEPDAVA
jgi:MFS family permease